MFACSLRIKTLFLIFSTLSLCIFFNLSCNSTTAIVENPDKFYKFKVTETKFDIGVSDVFEFSKLHFSVDGERVLAQYRKINPVDKKVFGWFIKISLDEGKTFGEEYNVAELINAKDEIKSLSVFFSPQGFFVIGNQDKNIFYTQLNDDLKSNGTFSQINDVQNSVEYNLIYVRQNQNDVYCIWNDNRRGFTLAFFSASRDDGKTWSANKPIDYDFREGQQFVRSFVEGENGRLLAFWDDWRDRKTLVDFRYSYSDDKGKTWSPSQKINDDEKEVWQHQGKAVAKGKDIYAVFSDFREKGEENDNDWNVYFAHSPDNGTTWKKNKRLNDIKEGIDGDSFLDIDKNGNLYCIWFTGRNSLFGQIAFSYSTNKGETWSPSITITSEDVMLLSPLQYIKVLSPKKIWVRVGKEEKGIVKYIFYTLEQTTEELTAQDIQLVKEKIIPPLKYETGKELFKDDFSNETAENWNVESGVWNIVGGTYMGVYPNEPHTPFISLAKFQEPEQYVLEGRFRFDTVAHDSALIYFRKDNAEKNHYVIANRFRVGAWLSLKNEEKINIFKRSGGIPLKQKRFPFRQDRWYKFSLVVTPEQVDYYVEGRLMLSYKGRLKLDKGKIGIGGYISAPTYFDDISISEIKVIE